MLRSTSAVSWGKVRYCGLACGDDSTTLDAGKKIRRDRRFARPLTVFACQLSPARLTSSCWSTGFYCQVLYAKVEPIKRRFDATAAHARGGSGGSDPREVPGRSDRSRRSFRVVPGGFAPAVPLFSTIRGQIAVLPCATRAHRGADTGRKAVSRGLTRQPRPPKKVWLTGRAFPSLAPWAPFTTATTSTSSAAI
jgi:hypothetical protein